MIIINVFLICCLLLTPASIPSKASQDKVYLFDFGPVKGPHDSGYINLSEKSYYKNKIGFGLLSDMATSFRHQGSRLLEPVEMDGIISEFPLFSGSIYLLVSTG